MESWRCHMKHSLEERMDIGRRMYLHEITYKEAMEIYGLSESCAHKYMTDYKKAQGIPLANTVPKMKNLQCVVSDMTAFHLKGSYYELTLFMDLWNNEILSYSLSSRKGDRMTYIHGLEGLIELKKKNPDLEMVLHTDQESVYSSKSFNELLPLYNIVHSMSRAGTPTDNAAMEAINGWIKAEIFNDFHLTSNENITYEVEKYIRFFNEERPAYSLNYLTPKQYREYYAH